MAEQQNPYAATYVSLNEPNVDDNIIVASRGSRLGAALLDLVITILILIVPFILIGLSFAKMLTGGRPSMSSMSGMVGLFVFLVLAMLIPFIINLVLFYKNGQTIGKKILSIKVVRSDGRRCGVWRWILLRYAPLYLVAPWILRVVIGNDYGPLVSGFLTLVSILLIFRSSRKCLHDDIADTIVVLA